MVARADDLALGLFPRPLERGHRCGTGDHHRFASRPPADPGCDARLLAIPLLSLAAAGLTPLGPRLLLSPLAVGRNASEFVGEWQSTSVHDPFAVVTLAMLGLVILSWVRLGRQPPWWQIGLLLTGVAATLATTRTIAVGAVIAARFLPTRSSCIAVAPLLRPRDGLARPGPP